MEKDKNKVEEVISLATMLGQGNSFKAQGKEYTIKPLKLKHVPEFLGDQISIGSQIYNLASEEAREKTNKWMQEILRDGDNSPVTLQQVMDDDWDVDDLKRFWRTAMQLAG